MLELESEKAGMWDIKHMLNVQHLMKMLEDININNSHTEYICVSVLGLLLSLYLSTQLYWVTKREQQVWRPLSTDSFLLINSTSFLLGNSRKVNIYEKVEGPGFT